MVAKEEGKVTAIPRAPKGMRQREQGVAISYLSSSNGDESAHDSKYFADVHVGQLAFLR